MTNSERIQAIERHFKAGNSTYYIVSTKTKIGNLHQNLRRWARRAGHEWTFAKYKHILYIKPYKV